MLDVKALLTNMLSSQIKLDNLVSKKVTRGKTYRVSGVADCAVLIAGKVGANGIVTIAMRNGGSASVTDCGHTGDITADIDSATRLTFTMAGYADGRAFLVFYNGTADVTIEEVS